jgi:malonate transporter and related proteins
MLDVINLVLPLFGLIFLGFFAGKVAAIPISGLAWLHFFVLYVALPSLIFQLLSETPVSEFSNLSFIAATTTATLLTFCLTFFVAGFRNGGNVGESAIQGFAGAYGNIGYMGPPLALAAFGPEAGVPVALIFCFDNSLHFTLAPLMMAFHRRATASPLRLVGDIGKRIFLHPFVVATIVAIFFAGFRLQPPQSVGRLLELLASAAAPCALFAMGVTAALRPLKRVPPELGYILPIKLVMHPLLAFGVLAVIAPQTDPVWVQVAVLMAALPAATNVFVIAQQYGLWQERASSAVAVCTFTGVFTITLYLYFARTGFLLPQ